MGDFWANLGALVPSIGVLAIFVVVVRSMIQGDRRARAERLKLEQELREDSPR
ncbi:hypothetical protein [Litorihabitans aurantiacus]|uniref:Heme exporter protein D n=1 Tax=Litorihabitans aurantiacus TaxID=1930061 RepID=A0AA38CV41_9MICO|nr:hypothetical protein [Litorihabitans aurantiacus]GMA32440.1 hypothetical protein GCM10025875_24320 [Litorihabitans aurantiacus]